MIAAGLTLMQAYADAVRRFTAAGFEAPAIEARALLGGLLRRSPTAVFLTPNEVLDEVQARRFDMFVERRLKREPAAYIIGLKNFMGTDFVVDGRVLVPRPETELLVEDLLMEVRDRQLENPVLLDVGTGSGCIAISLSIALPGIRVTAVDVSTDALVVASENARRLGVEIGFFKSDLFNELPPSFRGAFDMIASNPPYVASVDLPRLEPELSFEPRNALEAGPDGLSVVRRLVDQAQNFLKPGGLLAMEIGHNQGLAVQDLLTRAGYEGISILKDYSGHDRIAKGRKRGSI